MTARPLDELDRLGALARRGFSHAHMSDTKWRKMFSILGEGGLGLRQMIVKFIDVFEPRVMSFPSAAALHPPRPYLDTLEFGPIELRAIEWLEIPAVARLPRPNNLPAEEIPQDLSSVLNLLASLGRYPVERIAEGVRIVGYSR